MIADNPLSDSEVTATQGRFIPEEEPKVRLVGVTTVLRRTGLADDRWYTEEGRERGSTVAQFCQYELEGDLVTSSVDKRLRGYLAALRKFIRETNYKAISSEQRVINQAFGYQGRLDSWGGWNRGKVLVDFKTGSILWHARYQLVAYNACLESPQSFWRAVVQLCPNGEFHLKVFPPADYMKDWSTWTSIMDFYHLARANKRLRGDENRDRVVAVDDQNKSGLVRNMSAMEAAVTNET